MVQSTTWQYYYPPSKYFIEWGQPNCMCAIYEVIRGGGGVVALGQGYRLGERNRATNNLGLTVHLRACSVAAKLTTMERNINWWLRLYSK
jgi:hypothetical protein